MTKTKNNSPEMKYIRKKIDDIDSKLLPLMIKRSFLVKKALSLKKRKSEVVDIKRINQIKRKIKIKSKKLGADPKLIGNIWLSIIRTFIDYEKQKFKK